MGDLGRVVVHLFICTDRGVHRGSGIFIRVFVLVLSQVGTKGGKLDILRLVGKKYKVKRA